MLTLERVNPPSTKWAGFGTVLTMGMLLVAFILVVAMILSLQQVGSDSEFAPLRVAVPLALRDPFDGLLHRYSSSSGIDLVRIYAANAEVDLRWIEGPPGPQWRPRARLEMASATAGETIWSLCSR